MKATNIISTLLSKGYSQSTHDGIFNKILMTIYLTIIFSFVIIPFYFFKKTFGKDSLKLKKKYKSTFSVIDKQYSQNDFTDKI